MSNNRQYSGNPYQTPVKFRANAPTQTEEHTRSTTSQRKPPRVPDVEEDEILDDGWTVEKPHTSSVRYDRNYPNLSPRKNKQDRANTKRTQLVRERRFDRYTLMIIVGLALIVMIGGWLIFSLIANWWTTWQDDLHYGTPRTYQTDQFVGQGDSPDHPDHFIVVNSHGRVFVIQINPLNPKLDQIYGITTASDPKVPVSLTFRPTGNTWAMYVIVGDTTPYSVEYISNGQKFVPASS